MASYPRTSLMPRLAGAVIALVGGATILAALYFEFVVGLLPCKLCLYQRWPYYVGVPIALALALLPLSHGLARSLAGLLAIVFLVSAGLGIFHSGVEWGFWQGPSDCGGAIAPVAQSMDAFMSQLQTARVVDCAQAPWRFLFLSMAGWNAVISALLAALALKAALQRRQEPTRLY